MSVTKQTRGPASQGGAKSPAAKKQLRAEVKTQPKAAVAVAVPVRPAHSFQAIAVHAGGERRQESKRKPKVPEQREEIEFEATMGGKRGAAATESEPRAMADAAFSGAANPLPFRAVLERSFGGHRLDTISVHSDSRAGEVAGGMGAAAFASGERIALSRYAGLRTVAHEVAHIVWQRAGWAPASGVGKMGDEFERAADAVATRVLLGSSAADLLPRPESAVPFAGSGRAVQFDILGRLPVGADASTTPVQTVPTATTSRGVLEEMQAFVQRRAVTSYPEDQARAERFVRGTFFGLAGTQFVLYDPELNRVGSFPMSGTLPMDLPAGFYLDAGTFLQAAAVRGTRFYFGDVELAEEGAQRHMSDWFTAQEYARFQAATNGVMAVLFAVPPAGTGTGTGDLGWADERVERVRQSLQQLAASASTQQPQGDTRQTPDSPEETTPDGGETQEGPPSQTTGPGSTPASQAPTPGTPRRDLPDRIVAWHNERGAYVNVWVDGAHVALELTEDETPESLLERIQNTTTEMRDARDPNLSVALANASTETDFTAVDGATTDGTATGTGVRNPAPEQAVPGGERRANTPAYPASIHNFGPETTVTGATNDFEMRIDYSPAGNTTLDQVAARLQHINYYWELLDVTHVQPAEQQAAGEGTPAGGGEQVSRGSGTGSRLEQRLENIGEDTEADVNDLASGSVLELATTWPARVAWLEVVGISNIVRLGGSLISSYLQIVTQPFNAQSIGWSQEGDFLLRCVATPSADENATIIRASSIAVTVVRVRNINTRAAEVNTQAVDELARLRQQRAQTAEGPERDELDRQIAALTTSERGTVAENTSAVLQNIAETLRVLTELENANRAGLPRSQRSPESRLLDVQLQLSRVSIEDFRSQLERQQTEIQALLGRTQQFGREFSGSNYRPTVTLVSEESGQVIPMQIMLGESPGSSDTSRRYSLVDVSSAATQQAYHGRSRQSGLAGHQEAIRNAFVDFRENGEYGRGTLAVRLPPTLGEALGGTIDIDASMRMTPGQRGRAMQRLGDLATAAEIAGLLLAGPAAAVVGAVGAVAGAVVAIDSMSRRASGQRFEVFSFQTAMDVLSVVGAAAGVAGAGLLAVPRTARWVNRVERVQGALHIFGATQMGAQVFIIPYQLSEQLSAIDAMTELSPAERSARKAEAFLQAVRSSVVNVVSAAQMLESAGAGHGRGETPLATEETARAGQVEGAPPVTPEGAPARVTPEGTPATPEGGTATPREGPVPAEPAAPQAEPRTAPPAIQELTPQRAAELATGLGDLAGRVRIAAGEGLSGESARVRLVGDEVVIEVGEGVTPAQIADHVSTARVFLRFRGPMGRVRQLIDRVLTALRLTPGFGSQGFESQLEVRKLNEIITRLEGMRDQIQDQLQQAEHPASREAGEAQQRTLEEQIRVLEEQLAEHEALVNSYQPGRGFVAALDTPAQALTALQSRFTGDTFARRGDRIRIGDGIEIRYDRLRTLDETASGTRTELDVFMDAVRNAEAGTPLTPDQAALLGRVLSSLTGSEAASPNLRTAAQGTVRTATAEETKFLGNQPLTPTELETLRASRPDLAGVADLLTRTAAAGFPPEPLRTYLVDPRVLPEHRTRITDLVNAFLSDPRPITAEQAGNIPARFPAAHDLIGFLDDVGRLVPDELARPRLLRLCLLRRGAANPAAMIAALEVHRQPGARIDQSLMRFTPEELAVAQLLQSEGRSVLAMPRAQDFRLGDALVDGHLHDFKTPTATTASSVLGNITKSSQGGGQAGTVTLDLRPARSATGAAFDVATAIDGIGRASDSADLRAVLQSVRAIGNGFDITAEFVATAGLARVEALLSEDGGPPQSMHPAAAMARLQALAPGGTAHGTVTTVVVTASNMRATVRF